MSQFRPESSRSAFTLIEVLVAISVIGLLMGLLIPAVISSREASRRVDCMSRLKQIGAALSAHESTHGAFPSAFLARGIDKDGGPRPTNAPPAPHYQILPYLEQSALFNSVNTRPGSDLDSVARHQANQTAFGTALAVFLCPSSIAELGPGNSYRACVGSLPYEFDDPGRGGGGAFTGYRGLAPRDFEDGLSRTAGFSERTMGSGPKARPARDRDIWYSGLSALVSRPSADRVLAGCGAAASAPPEAWTRAGESWLQGGYPDTLYNHIAPPNWSGMDCSLGAPVADPGSISGGAFTARSQHRGGVNVLLMDGSVQAVSSTIDLKVWRALGTRSGHETVQ